MTKLTIPGSKYSVLEYSILTTILLLLFASLSFAQDQDSAMATLLKTNLLSNPGAETKDASGWESVTVDASGKKLITAGLYPTPSSTSGSYYFRGVVGGEQREASAYQYFDLSILSDVIDKGALAYNLSGSFGGGDYATSLINVQFLDAKGNNIRTYYTKNIILDEVGADSLNIYPTGKTGTVPKGTRKMTVQLRFYKYSILDEPSVAFADNLGLYLYRKY